MVKTQIPVTHWDENVNCIGSFLPGRLGHLLFLFLESVYPCQCLVSIRWLVLDGMVQRKIWSIFHSHNLRSIGGLPWDAVVLPQTPLFRSSSSCPSRTHCPSCSTLAVFTSQSPRHLGENKFPSWFLFFDYCRSSSSSFMCGP